MNGKTLGLLGLGKLGEKVAKVGLALGMDVIAWSQNLTDERCAEVGVTRVGKDALFAESDLISIHLVLSDRTRGLVGRAEFSLMKPSAYLINTSRGAVVDQYALVEALKTGIIAGAGLDVFDPEPPNADDPLLTLDNVILTPHSLCWTDQCFAGIGAQDLDHVLAIKRGTPPSVLVDPNVVDNPEFKIKLERYKNNFT